MDLWQPFYYQSFFNLFPFFPAHRFLSWAFVSINAVLLHALGIERFSSMSALLLILQLTSASAIMTSELSNRFFYVGKVRTII